MHSPHLQHENVWDAQKVLPVCLAAYSKNKHKLKEEPWQ